MFTLELLTMEQLLRIKTNLLLKLVFMIVGLTRHWKHPIAYVLENKCSVTVESQQIHDCFRLFHIEEIDVLAIIFDGIFPNLTAKRLKVGKLEECNHGFHIYRNCLHGSMSFFMFVTCLS